MTPQQSRRKSVFLAVLILSQFTLVFILGYGVEYDMFASTAPGQRQAIEVRYYGLLVHREEGIGAAEQGMAATAMQGLYLLAGATGVIVGGLIAWGVFRLWPEPTDVGR